MEHAKLSPSAADSWTVCTMYPEVYALYEDEPGPSAVKGISAHLLLEKAILQKKHPRGIDPGNPSIDGVTQAYEQVAPLLKDPKCQVFAETQVRYSDDLWGTVDIVVIHNDGRMVIIDYKNGVMPVAADCLQLLIYSAAALKTMAWLSPMTIKEVGCIIIQPNGLDGETVKTYNRTVEEVGHEMDEKVLPAVETIMAAGDPSVKDQPQFVVSEKGCRWCPHGKAGKCEALAATALDTVKARFNEVGALTVPEIDVVDTLTDDQVAQILTAWPLVLKFKEGIDNRAINIAKSGGKIPGFKMVHGRTNRSWSHTNNTETLDFLTKTLKFKKMQVVNEKVISPAAVEKLINNLKRNKEAKQKLFEEVVEKKEGKLTMVSDKSKKKEVVMFQELPANSAGSILG